MNDELSNTPTYDQRVIRVFVSSTFRDMQAERDELIKQIFPRLRKLCDERNVVWSEVDLRWGITQEQSERGEVLPICLAEIQRCRPYFIGLPGERYGWVPDEIPAELIEQEAWLKEHLNHSVTELEILHGVLRDKKMNDHALFYFRGSAYLNSLSDQEKSEFIESATEDEIKRYGQTEAESRAAERRHKLVALKERIREHCEKNKMPPPQVYPSPKELGEMVWHDMSAIIERLYPIEDIPEPLDRDALEHDAFAQSRAKVYIGRQSYFDRLDAHAQSEDQPIVVLGESGSGKSALLANWALQYHQKHAEDLLIMHFIGATPYSADWAAMLRRIMGELKRRFDIQQEIPDKTDELKPAFANWLYMAAAKGRVVLILDALNQLEDRDGALDLVWLDFVIPPNVRMILSTLPGRPLGNLKERGWATLQIEPLDFDERKKLIKDYLAQFSKELNEIRIGLIAKSEQAANPLFLRALLDELRVFGIHEKLDRRIGHYLEAKTIDKLYEKILDRYKDDYERERPDLVKDAMSLIWASRHGLSEMELLDLLGANNEPLPRAFWSPLYLAAEPAFVKRSGLIGFGHKYFRQAIYTKYLENEQNRNIVHLKLADYFETQNLGIRKVNELPWQLSKLNDWERLYQILLDLKFFDSLWEANQFDLKKYWSKTEENTNRRINEAYILKSISTNKTARFIPLLLYDTGYNKEALSLQKTLLKIYYTNNETEEIKRGLQLLGSIYTTFGERTEDIKIYTELEKISRDTNDSKSLQESLLCQANALLRMHNESGALELLEEQRKICSEINDNDGLSKYFGTIGVICFRRDKLEEALKNFKKQEELAKSTGNLQDLSSSLGSQGNIYAELGFSNQALSYLREQEEICRQIGQKDGLQGSLGNQATVYFRRGAFFEALRLHGEEEKICREIGAKASLSTCLNNKAMVFMNMGLKENAISALKEQEQILIEIGDKINLKKCRRRLYSMSEEGRYEFKGSSLVMAGIFISILAIRYFEIISWSWLFIVPLAFILSAIVTSFVSTIVFSIKTQ